MIHLFFARTFLSLAFLAGVTSVNATEGTLISDSNRSAFPTHTVHFTGAQLRTTLTCDYVDTNYDSIPDSTLAKVDIAGEQLPNVALNGHHFAVFVQGQKDEALCASVSEVLIENPAQANFHFQLFMGHDALTEVVTLEFANGLKLASKVAKVLFR